MNLKKKDLPIPIFFAVDDHYAPYLAVAMRSLIDNADPDFQYHIYILIDQLSEEHRANLSAMQTDRVKVEYVNVAERLSRISSKLHLRDYYTKATYYRFFIPDLFPQYDRGVYLDCDIAVLGDISELYGCDLGNHLVAAVTDEVVTGIPTFARYAEKVLGIPREEYFNAGILVMNLKELRKVKIEKALVRLMAKHQFHVAQDQDYLNVLCHRRTVYLDLKWNKTASPDSDPERPPCIAHFKINFKPWKYDGVAYEEYFWQYAEKTVYYEQIKASKAQVTEDDKEVDAQQYRNLLALAQSEIALAEGNDYEVPLQFSLYRGMGM